MREDRLLEEYPCSHSTNRSGSHLSHCPRRDQYWNPATAAGQATRQPENKGSSFVRRDFMRAGSRIGRRTLRSDQVGVRGQGSCAGRERSVDRCRRALVGCNVGYARQRLPSHRRIAPGRLDTFKPCELLLDSHSTLIASTGHCSAASRQASSAADGTGSILTSALSPSI